MFSGSDLTASCIDDSHAARLLHPSQRHIAPLAGPTPLPELVDALGLAGKPVVVELDGRALPRSTYADTTVHPGATIEIVTLAAGG